MSRHDRHHSPEPLRLPARDGEEDLFGHLEHLRDAVPEGNSSRITSATTLVVLHRKRTTARKQEKKTLLENFTGVADTKVLCKINGDGVDQSWFPKEDNTFVRVTFDKLLLAPVLRLECKFRQYRSASVPSLTTLILEFHLNRNDQVDPITDLNLTDGGNFTFTTTGATSAGFNNIPALSQYLSTRQREFVDLLLRLRSPESPRDVKLRMDYGSLTSSDRAMLNSMIRRLQGSFADRIAPTVAEYSAFRRSDGELHFKHNEMQSVKQLMEGKFPHPMTVLECSDTFSTVAEAQIQLAYSAVVMDAESRATLLLWAGDQRGGFLYNGEDFPVLAVRNGRQSLPGATGSIKLPNELECWIEMSYEEMKDGKKKYSKTSTVGHLLASNPGLPHHDAYFRLGMSKGSCNAIIEAKKMIEQNNRWIHAKFTPHINSFTFSSQLATCQKLGREYNERWRPILLNQRHDTVPEVDVTAMSKIEPTLRTKADTWLRSCKQWNEEQMQVINNTISGKVKGALTIVMGPAGTGKTTLHIALTLYFWVLGYRILSLAPANSNCNHVASYINVEELQKEFPGFDQFGLVNSHVLRLFPGSRDVKVKEMTDEQTKHKNVGHKDRRVLSLVELVFALQEEKSGVTTAQARGVIQTVIKLADDGFRGYDPKPAKRDAEPRVDEVLQDDTVLQERETNVQIGPSMGEQVSKQEETQTTEPTPSSDAATEQNAALDKADVNYWDTLRRYIKLARTLDLKKEMERLQRADEAVRKYRHIRPAPELIAYEGCMEEVMGHNRFLITTTGNVRSHEMMNWWSNWHADSGVVCFIDEAAKDLEVNVWASIVCERWAPMVQGVYLFGDDRQLKPTNTCIQHFDQKTGAHTQYNAYFDRLDISLPGRLVAEGFPYVRLKEQRRMNKSISDFPNRKVYGGELRDGPGMDKSLEDVKPGLLAVLTDIIAKGSNMSDHAREAYIADASEEKARLHWIQVNGDREKNDGQSCKVEEHVQVFFSKIYPRLLAYFQDKGEKIADSVMIICAYGHTIQRYEAYFTRWKDDHPGWTDDDQPRLLTVDSSQGQEAMMVIFDGACQSGFDIGFLRDGKRVNVAATRSKEILWIIGGSMKTKFSSDERFMIAQYYDELAAAGKAHQFLNAKEEAERG